MKAVINATIIFSFTWGHRMGLLIEKWIGFFRLVSLCIILLVGACAAPEKKPALIAQKKLPAPALPSLNKVFTGLTGYGLGDLRRQEREDEFGKCVAAGRFGNKKMARSYNYSVFRTIRAIHRIAGQNIGSASPRRNTNTGSGVWKYRYRKRGWQRFRWLQGSNAALACRAAEICR